MLTQKHILAIIILLVADVIWISKYMGPRYQVLISNIQGSPLKMNMTSAVLAYSLMVIGLLLFVLPNIKEGSELQDSLKYGFIYGIVLYGVYDFTCGAVFSKWDFNLALKDVMWGGFVYFISSYLSSIIKLSSTIKI